MNPTEDLQSPPYLSPSLIPIFQIQLPHGTVQHSFKNAIGQFKGIIQPLLLRQLPRAQHALTIDSVLQRLQGGGIIMRIGHADWTRGDTTHASPRSQSEYTEAPPQQLLNLSSSRHPRDSNKGILNARYEPSPPLLDATRELNTRIHPRIQQWEATKH